MKTSIIGCGGIANVHANVLSTTEGVELISVCDTNFSNAQVMGEKYNCKSFNNFYELLKWQKPDVVHICTPHYTHAPLAYYALSQGIHVLLEKPMTMLTGEIDVLKNKLENCSDLNFGVCFQNRFNQSSQAAKKAIQEEGGKVLGIRGFLTWKRDENYYTGTNWRGSKLTEGGGVLINQAIHTIDLMHWLVGNVPQSIDGKIFNGHLKNIIEVEDTASIFFDYGNGVSGIFYATTSYCTDKDVLIEIECENVFIQIMAASVVLKYKNGEIKTLENIAINTIGKNYWGQSHESLINSYYLCLQNNEKFEIDVTEGAKALQTIFFLYKNV